MPKKIAVAVTGASGLIYAQKLLEQMVAHGHSFSQIALIFSETGRRVWEYELGSIPEFPKPVEVYENNNMFSPVASGSAAYDAMVVVPCTMGTLGRIAAGTSPDLISRAADVMLKERRKLILVPRELPYSLIHIENMRTITLAGGIILPASPSFYSLPQNIDELVLTVVNRILDVVGIETHHYRWGDEKK